MKHSHSFMKYYIKVVCGEYRGTTDAPVTDKQGRLLTSKAEIDARCAEHFSQVLNRPPPTAEADIQEAEHDLDVNTAPLEKEEIISAIKSLKNRKAPGQDNLNAELFKADLACVQTSPISFNLLHAEKGRLRKAVPNRVPVSRCFFRIWGPRSDGFVNSRHC